MKILVIQQKMIGDVLTTSVLFEALRKQFPEARLDYLINTNTVPVVENNPHIDNIVQFTKETETSVLNLLKLGLSIRKTQYNVVIDVYSKLSSNIITLLSGAKTRISYYKYYSAFMYTHNIKRSTSTEGKTGLAIINRFQLLEPLGIETNDMKPKIYFTPSELSECRSFLESKQVDTNKPLFMISVLGSGDNKTYPFKYMATIIDLIVQQTQGQILFNYIPNQEAQAKAIFGLCTADSQDHIYFEVFGKNLRQFLAITSQCDALIGNEGGAVNMAKAIDVPTFAIFSPWIDKDTWNLFEDNSYNTSVHLRDFKPELYNGVSAKNLKENTKNLYSAFEPNLFQGKLNVFLQQILRS